MPRKRKIKRWKKPSANPLNNLNLSEYTNPEKVKAKKEKEENYKSFQKEYERLLHREVRREEKAYRVVYKNHPDLLFVAFAQDREKAKYQSARYFKSAYHPFFTGEDYRKEMLKSHAYRCQELDKYAFEGTKYLTSVILPAVIKKIAELKELPTEVVERAVFENTLRLFSLPITK